jgi:hypothetical protein
MKVALIIQLGDVAPRASDQAGGRWELALQERSALPVAAAVELVPALPGGLLR